MTAGRGRNAWLAVAAADHVAIGLREGFMQVGHGKLAPLRRLAAGDVIIYYSPVEIFGERDGLQSFTAIGLVRAREPYQVETRPDFHPYRRDVDWLPAERTPIRPLLGQLTLTAGRSNWGYRLRLGLQAIASDDARAIAAAMGVTDLGLDAEPGAGAP